MENKNFRKSDFPIRSEGESVTAKEWPSLPHPNKEKTRKADISLIFVSF